MKKDFTLGVFGFVTLLLIAALGYSCQSLAARNGPRNEDGKVVSPGDKRGKGQAEKVFLCHVNGDGEENTLELSQNALDSHLSNHEGDHLGECTVESHLEGEEAGSETDSGLDDELLDSGLDDELLDSGDSPEEELEDGESSLHQFGELTLLVQAQEDTVEDVHRVVGHPNDEEEGTPVGCTCNETNLANLALFGIPFVMIRRRKKNGQV